ncbi:MAG: UDP-glucose/GDP-mannose dehydrogenase family protein [Planctomycetes bacterium]|nr:UDP-glucose/GDP-mannose dehydrogenase family protein [Planctomycetota bacterium]
MRIAVFGAGYVGLVAGTCFAETGNDVTVVDVDAIRIQRLNAGEVPIYEPGLEELVKRNREEERLSFVQDGTKAVRDADVIFIAVGTPMSAAGKADLRYVLEVARTIGQNLNGYKVIVDKSTVPVGTGDLVRAEIAAHTKHEFDVVSNPEFLKEGAAIDDFMKPDRVVIGANSERARAVMTDLYTPFVRTNKPILHMDVRSAELTKYAANAMLATRISFMNEMARLCELLGANIEHVRRGVGSDARIGFPFLFPGPGYGGSCFPKDLQALMNTGREAGYEPQVLRAVEEVNTAQKHRLAEKVQARLGADLKGRTVAVWGLAFKPNTDDMREAPSLVLIQDLLAAGAHVRATDPEGMGNARKLLAPHANLSFHERNYDAAQGADALVLVTEWNEYRRPDFRRIKELMRAPHLIDGRNIWTRAAVETLGFSYEGIGL